MPNYKLSTAVQDQIRGKATALTQRRIVYAHSAFPLSLEEIQHAIVSPEDVATLKRLRDRGMSSIPTSRSLTLYAGMPELTRRVGLDIVVPDEVFYPRYMSTTGYGGELDVQHAETECVKLGTDHLAPETLAALVKWINGAVRERRLAEMTRYLVHWMLERHVPTTGHLLARWPVLALLVEDKTWKSRLQHPPVRTNPYKWDARKPDEAMFKLMAAAEVVLTSASIMEDYSPDVTKPIAVVTNWERLKNDRSF